MNVEVVCFGAMRDYLPEGATSNKVGMTLPEGSTIGDLVDLLGARRELVRNALVDGRRAGLETVLQTGMQVTLMPPFTGGSEAIP